MAKAGTLTIDLEARVARLETDMNKVGSIVDRRMRSISRSVGRAKAALGGLAGVVGVRAITGAIAEYEKMEASLRTVTGSAAAASLEWGRLKQFTSDTPFQLQEVVGAFIKLKALGLDPSTEALRAYGNTASAMGKDLNQFVEAVADAATGEFERLKEFGIKARQQGDNVSLTFQGVTTTIKKNASEIERYLRKIGGNQFAGAMNEQMETLGGTFSNLKDAGYQLAESLGKAGLSSVIKGLAWVTKSFADHLTRVANFMQGPAPLTVLRDTQDRLLGAMRIAEQTLDRLRLDPTKNAKSIAYFSDTLQRLRNELQGVNEQMLRAQGWTPPPAIGPKAVTGAMVFAGDSRLTHRQAEDESFARFTTLEMAKTNTLREALGQRVQALRESFFSEQQAEMQKYTLQQGLLQEALDNEVLTRVEHHSLLEEATTAHEARMTEIADAAAQERIGIEAAWGNTVSQMRNSVFQNTVGLMRGLAGESRSAAIATIAIEKGWAIAQNTANTTVAAMRALAELGPIAGPPIAAKIKTLGAVGNALIAAQGLGQAASIGGGGAALGSPANPVTVASAYSAPQQAQQSTRYVTVNIVGNFHDGNSVRALIDQINEEVGDGVTLVASRSER